MGVDGTGVFPQKNVERIFRCGVRRGVRGGGAGRRKGFFFQALQRAQNSKEVCKSAKAWSTGLKLALLEQESRTP